MPKNSFQFDSRPHFLGLATFHAEYGIVGEFECGFFLPKSEVDKMWLLVRVGSPEESPVVLCWKSSCELIAGSNVLSGEEVFHSGYTQWDWGNGVENTLVGEITRLTVNRGDVLGSAISKAQFVITPSALLRSADLVSEQDEKLVVRQIIRKGPVCSVSSDIAFHFGSVYRRETSGKLRSGVECELIEPMHMRDSNRVLSLLRDVLAVASLAERRVLMVAGWTVTHANGATTTYYRRHFTAPSEETADVDSTLISLRDIEEFLNVTVKKFGSQPHSGALKQAIYFALHGQGRGIGDSFVMLFAGIETLLNVFHPARVSFSNRFERMCSSAKIDLADLWPMLGRKNSLYAVRNRIVHGSVFSSDQEWFRVISAKFHVLWTLERSILSILGWPIERSRCSARSLCGITFYSTWREDWEYFSTAR
jgi:hypothetical protein